MQYLLPIGVGLLMISVGLSLNLREVLAHWRRLGWFNWLSLVLATFVVPPATAVFCSKLFHLSAGETAGLFMVGAAPGAPLLTRNLARKGFDMQMAASYQVWAALMVPVMIPIIVLLGGKLYERDIWIPPRVLLEQIAYKQLVPLAIGMVIAWIAPGPSQRIQPRLNVLGNLLVLLLIILVLIQIGPALKQITPWVPVAALILAAGSILVILPLRFSDSLVRGTFAICNANRHAGLALLLTGQYVQGRNALPTIACYALLTPFVMAAYVRIQRKLIAKRTAEHLESESISAG
jgi:predicted Na+-dependent transporter